MSKEQENQNPESTVFSAPPEHNDKPTKAGKKKITVLICGILAVALLCGGIFAAVKFLPDKEAEVSQAENLQLVKIDSSKIDSVELTESGAVTEFYKKNEENEVKWYIKDVDEYKIGTVLTGNFIDALCDISGTEIESGKDFETLYGFDNPKSVIKVSGEKNYTVLLGKSFENGAYLKVTGDFEGSISVNYEKTLQLEKKRIDFANNDSYSPASFTADVSAYKDEGGALLRFDSLTLSGTKYNEQYVFGMNGDELCNLTVPHVMTAPKKAFAANVDNLLYLFTNALGVSAAYTYTDTPEDIAKYGLDNPYIEVKLTVAGETKWFKFAKAEEGFCAVLSDDFHMIRKVPTSNISFFDMTLNDYIYSGIIPYELAEINEFKCESVDVNADYLISAADGGITVTKDGAEVKSFDAAYSDFLALKPTAFSSEESFKTYDAKITLTLSDGRTLTVLFKKGSGTKCAYKAGDSIGEITTSAYNAFMKKLGDVK